MMSKASFMMQDHLRRNFVMITDVGNPTTFFVRGRLPFPQGLLAVAVLFKNKRPADVYAHPYFIEKQSDPSQPSPQLHLTEESQGIMKVISGLRYMRDDNTKLDNTMVVVTDYKVEVEGRMPVVPPEAAEPRGGPQIEFHHNSSSTSTASVGNGGEESAKKERLTLEQRALLRRPVHHVTQIPGGGGDAGLGSGGTSNPAMASVKSSSSSSSSSSANREDISADTSAMPGYSTFPTPEECAADAWTVYRFLKAAVFGRRALREEEDANAAHKVNVPALFEHRSGGYTVLYNPIEVNEKTFVELLLKLQREERVVKAIVVPTRPAWRHLQVWADVFPDAELICSGDVPLVRTAGAVPNPKIVTVTTAAPPSTTSPRAISSSLARGEEREVSNGSASKADGSARSDGGLSADGADGAAWRGGCQDLGNGLTGLSFPEVDLEAEAAAEKQRAEAAAAHARATAEAARLEQEERRQQQRYQQSPRHPPSSAEPSPAAVHDNSRQTTGTKADGAADTAATAAKEDPYAVQRRRQEEKIRLRQEMAEEDARDRASAARSTANPQKSNGGAVTSQTDSNGGEDEEGDLVDVLWHDASFFAQKVHQPVGLRESDADRLRILSPRSAAPPSESARSPAQPSNAVVDRVELTPTIELLRIPGDRAAEEYVLYDSNTQSLACTDLYHGEYADLDAANSWMCRVWFKFMKRGNYKRADIAPRYKWLQVLQQRSLPTLQNSIEELTRTRPIKFLLFAHGTPPLQEGGANMLRQQWSLPPLHRAELPRDPRGRP